MVRHAATDWDFSVVAVVLAALMLPVTVQFVVAMLAYALNKRMAREADHLREENRVLKEALRATPGKSRIPPILAWFRQLVARKDDQLPGPRARQAAQSDPDPRACSPYRP